MKVVMLVLFALLCGSTSGVAQQMDARAQAAAELLNVMGYQQEADKGVEQIVGQFTAMQPVGSDTAFVTALRNFMEENFTWERLKPEYVRIYADLFTTEELRQMIAFYQTPTGQKLVQLRPEITERSMQLAQRMMPQMLEYIRARENKAAPARPLP